MEKQREQQLYLARLAEQAERYDGLLSFLLSLSFFASSFAALLVPLIGIVLSQSCEDFGTVWYGLLKC